MLTKKIACGFALILLTAGVAAQTPKDSEKALRNSLLKKQFFLRGFNANPEIRWRWDGSALVQEPSRFHTLGVLTPIYVNVEGDTVRIEGQRRTFLRSGDKGFTLSEDEIRVRVVVDLKVADMANLLPKLPDLLFYPDLNSALADLPEEYRGLLPAESGLITGKARPKNCDCSSPRAVECGQGPPEAWMAGMNPPKLLKHLDAEFPNSVRAEKLDAYATVAFIVNTAGRPDFLWVSKPSDDEVNASALRAVSQYTFKPATCHDQPVAVYLFVDVNFQIH